MGVGRREAFGVRQLAAAFFLCPNNVSVPISAPLSWGFTPRWYEPRRWRFDHRPIQPRCPWQRT
ncbi:MAG: hypothetical protein GX456_08675 [Verrucomicrobia bacterium]|nr:hypothetical protein [Verrucomicrobiota bacterium]